MNDLLDADIVEIVVDQTGKVWINVDHKCALRIGHAKVITMDDPLRGFNNVYQDDNSPSPPEGESKALAKIAPLPWSGKIEECPIGGECDDVDTPFIIRDANGKEVITIYEKYGVWMEEEHRIIGEAIVAALHPTSKDNSD